MNPADVAFDAALEALGEGLPELAIRRLHEVLAEAPHDLEAVTVLVGLLRESGSDQEAEAALVAFLRAPPKGPPAAVGKLPDLWAALADVRLALGDLAGAARACRRGLALAPRHAELHWLLGNAFLDAGAPREAADAYRRALASRPFDPETWHNLGVALERLGEVEAAAKALATSERLGTPTGARRPPDWGLPVLDDEP